MWVPGANSGWTGYAPHGVCSRQVASTPSFTHLLTCYNLSEYGRNRSPVPTTIHCIPVAHNTFAGTTSSPKGLHDEGDIEPKNRVISKFRESVGTGDSVPSILSSDTPPTGSRVAQGPISPEYEQDAIQTGTMTDVLHETITKATGPRRSRENELAQVDGMRPVERLGRCRGTQFLRDCRGIAS